MHIIRYTDGKDTIIPVSMPLKKSDKYTVFDSKHNKFSGTGNNAADDSDRFRWDMACTVGKMLWLDNDAQLLSLPEFKKGRPYFCQVIGQPDIWGFYVNDCCDFFKGIKSLMPKVIPAGYNYGNLICGLLRNRLNDVYLIPNGYIVHKPKS